MIEENQHHFYIEVWCTDCGWKDKPTKLSGQKAVKAHRQKTGHLKMYFRMGPNGEPRKAY